MRKNLLIKLKFGLLFFALWLMSGISFAALPKVLVLAADDSAYIADVQSKLNATGMFSAVDVINTTSSTPDIATLEEYNAVLVFTDDSPDDTALLGNNLAAYIENGGGVVDAVFENASIPLGGKFDSIAYRCLVPLDQTEGTELTLDSILLPNHPIMKDVISFDGGTESYVSTSDSLAPGAYVIALYDNKAICIAARENVGSAKVRRVSLNFFPPSSDALSGCWDPSTDGAKIMANALTWVSNLHSYLPKVLIAGAEDDDSWIYDVRNKILSTGMFSEVDTVNLMNVTPSLNTLKNYKAILIWADEYFMDTLLLGNNLASYVDLGGIVVDANFDFDIDYKIGGRFNSLNYGCLMPGGLTDGSTLTLGTIQEPGHAIMNGINSFNGGTSSYCSTSDSLAPGAYVVASYDNDDILIAARENVGAMKVRRVSLNFYPVSSDMRSDFWDKTTDGAKIMANALIWAMTTNNNNCLNFDGVDDYVSTDINPAEAPFTYMASVFPAEGSNEKMILGTCTNTSTWDGFWFEVDGENLRFYAGSEDIYSTDTLPINQWSNVAVTYDTSTFIVKIYINGLLEAEENKDLSGIGGGALQIGAIGTGALDQYLFYGNLDNLSIWNKALSGAEILKYQNKELSGRESGLVDYYDFNQGIAGGDNPKDTILLDSKSTLNKGILHNFALTGGNSNWIGSIAYSINNIPSIQAKDIIFSGVSTNKMNLSWTRGNGDSCIVFVKLGSTGSSSPLDDTTYTANPSFINGSQIESSGWYSVYKGTGNSVTVTNLNRGATYIVHVCEYTGSQGSEEYNISTAENNPAVKSILTLINSLTGKGNFIIYPNPVSEILIVENPNYKIIHYVIYDINGRARLSGSLENGNINVSKLKSGLYILEINGTQKFKLIKQ